MNAPFPGRLVVIGKNSELSATAMQDAGGAPPPDDDMGLYTAYLHSRQMGEHFLRAHILRKRDPYAADHNHTLAMAELDQLAELRGLELVPREEVKTR